MSPSYGTAVKCPVCSGTGSPGVTQPKPPTTIPYTQPLPSIGIGKCPNVGPNGMGVCFCTGACMKKDATDWIDWFNAYPSTQNQLGEEKEDESDESTNC